MATKVTRKINGKEVELTPTENFTYATNKRLQMLEYQFQLLGKQSGPQYQYNEQVLALIEEKITGMLTGAIGRLKTPGAKVHSTDFTKELAKVNS